jgi:hypothetical protein
MTGIAFGWIGATTSFGSGVRNARRSFVGYTTGIRRALEVFAPAPMGIHDAILAPGRPVLCSMHDRAHLSIDPVTIMHVELIFESDVRSMD